MLAHLGEGALVAVVVGQVLERVVVEQRRIVLCARGRCQTGESGTDTPVTRCAGRRETRTICMGVWILTTPGTLGYITGDFLSLFTLGESFVVLAPAPAEDREKIDDTCFAGALTPGLRHHTMQHDHISNWREWRQLSKREVKWAINALCGGIVPVHEVVEVGQLVTHVPRQAHCANMLVWPIRLLKK